MLIPLGHVNGSLAWLHSLASHTVLPKTGRSNRYSLTCSPKTSCANFCPLESQWELVTARTERTIAGVIGDFLARSHTSLEEGNSFLAFASQRTHLISMDASMLRGNPD